MKKIKLDQGKVTLVDDDDYKRLLKYDWKYLKTGTGYAYTHIDKKIVMMHRFILNLNPTDSCVDHINHDGFDNRKKNLRVVSQRRNTLNKTKKNKYPGAMKAGSRYVSQIHFCGEYFVLGRFDTAWEASNVYMDSVDFIEHTEEILNETYKLINDDILEDPILVL